MSNSNIIQTSLEVVRKRLDDYLQNLNRRQEDWVILSNIMDHDGKVYEPARGKMVMTLVSLAQETTLSAGWNATEVRRGYVIKAPPLHVELTVLFMANMAGAAYSQGLTMLSRTVSFFQQNPIFTREQEPDLDPSVQKLTLDMLSLDLAQTGHVLGSLGAKQLPMVCYRVRMLTFSGSAYRSERAPARAISTRGAATDPEQFAATMLDPLAD